MNEELGTPVGDVYQVDINSDMYFILCSDGLTDVVSEDKIEKILNNSNKSSIKSIGRKLVDLALIGDENNKGGRDNITVLIVKIENNKQWYQNSKLIKYKNTIHYTVIWLVN